MLFDNIPALAGFFYVLLELSGIAAAIDAVMTSRTTQGAIAWAVSLVSFPLISLPLYLIFGRSKFSGYISARRAGDLEINHIAEKLKNDLQQFSLAFDGFRPEIKALEVLARLPFTRHNSAELLIDGDATFGAIFEAIDGAREYVLIQFFIVHDDKLGRELKRRLIRKVSAGVRIYFLYDEIGCHKLPSTYLDPLREAGVEVTNFNTARGWLNRFRLNFRNHRKIVVVDGGSAFVGGLNVGDEYMGRNPKIGPWRDTHVKVIGPCVKCIQLSFLEDWYWATHRVPGVDWTPRPSTEEDRAILVLPSGPADELETCALFFVHVINSARRRLWIASPYFVPDPQIVSALQLASLRGVDVRIILPQNPDHLLVYLSSFSFLAKTEGVGVKFYRYQPGFMHHKVMVVDDSAAMVGTANFDNRSFRINFEITLLFADPVFTRETTRMLIEDLSRCKPATAKDYHARPIWFKLAVRTARLMAPIQ